MQNFFYLYFLISLFILIKFRSYEKGYDGFVLCNKKTGKILKENTEKEKKQANILKLLYSLFWGAIAIKMMVDFVKNQIDKKDKLEKRRK